MADSVESVENLPDRRFLVVDEMSASCKNLGEGTQAESFDC